MSFRDGIRRAIRHHNSDAALADKERRISEIVALCNAAQRGGIAIDRALTEIVETARGHADRIVRVGEEIRPDIQTGETR